MQVSTRFGCKTTCITIVDDETVLLKTAAPKPFAVVEKHNYIFPRAQGLVGWLVLPECRQVILVDDPAADIRCACLLTAVWASWHGLLLVEQLLVSHAAGGPSCWLPWVATGSRVIRILTLAARAEAHPACRFRHDSMLSAMGWFVGVPLIASNGQRVGGM